MQKTVPDDKNIKIISIAHLPSPPRGTEVIWWWCCCWDAQLWLTLCNPMDCSMPCFLVLHCPPEFVQIHVHWVGDAIQASYPHCPLLLMPSIFSTIRVFSSESTLHIKWPKYWSFSFNISPSNEQISVERIQSNSFTIDWAYLVLGSEEG